MALAATGRLWLYNRILRNQFNIQHSTMSSVLPSDIIAEIIDIIEENEDTNLLKELALVSHSFLHMCSKHLFATVELQFTSITAPMYNEPPSKKAFVKLLESRPNVVQYIRKLTYTVEDGSWECNDSCPEKDIDSEQDIDSDNHLLATILPNLLRTIPHLNCLSITGGHSTWNELDSSLSSAFLHLMHLPTMDHIRLSGIRNFPLSSLTPSVNLYRLDLSNMNDDDSPEIVQLDIMPKIRDFRTTGSSQLVKRLLYAKTQDERPAFSIVDLRRLLMTFTPVQGLENERNIQHLLQNAELLEELYLLVGYGQSLVGLLSLSARTLKTLYLSIPFHDHSGHLPLAGLCEELEAMAGQYMLEALSFEFRVTYHETIDSIGSKIQGVEKVLLKPGWSALRQVSFTVMVDCCMLSRMKACEALQSLPEKYLSHLSKLESVLLNYSAQGVCAKYHVL